MQIEVRLFLLYFFLQELFGGIELLQQGEARHIHVAIALVLGLGIQVLVQCKSLLVLTILVVLACQLYIVSLALRHCRQRNSHTDGGKHDD